MGRNIRKVNAYKKLQGTGRWLSRSPGRKPEQKANGQMPLPNPRAPSASRVLPMDLKVGDRLADETGEWEVVSRPYTTNAGKDVQVRVKRVDNADVTIIRTWGAHERILVRRETQ